MRTWNKVLIAGVALVLAGVGAGSAVADEVGDVGSAVVVPLPLGGSCADRTLLFCEDFDALAPGEASSPDWGVDFDRGSLTVEADEDGRPGNQV